MAKELMLIWLEQKRRLVILDSKPRWRGEILTNSLPAKRLYRGMNHGDVLAGSVVVRNMDEFIAAWKYHPERPIIVQSDIDMDLHAAAATYVYEASKKEKRPVLIYIDETMDHFYPSGQPISTKLGRIYGRICRSGRELGLAALFASQRTKSIPVSIMEEMSYLFLFEIDFDQDLARLKEMGIKGDIPSPKDHSFFYYRRAEKKFYGPFKLKV